MTLDENTKSEETKDEIKGASDLVLWNTFFWKLIRSLVIVAVCTTAIVFICRWLIY